MIKVVENRTGCIKLKDPDNLVPIIFKCRDCGCTIRKIEETQSYILLNINKEIDEGKRKLCHFCYKLNECRGLQ